MISNAASFNYMMTAAASAASSVGAPNLFSSGSRSASSKIIRTMNYSHAAAATTITNARTIGRRFHGTINACTLTNIRQNDFRRRRQSPCAHSSSSTLRSSSSTSSGSSSSSSSSSFAGSGGGGTFSFSSFFQWYSNKLDTHPITTKCVSAGLVSSLGNILAQAITHYQELNQKQEQKQNETSKAKRQWQEKHQQQDDTYLLDKKKDNNDHDDEVTAEQFQVDLAQVSRFAFLNVVFVAPILHHWYQFINRAVPGTSFSRVAQRVFWDEFVFSPMYLPVFLGMLWKLEGSSNDDIIKMIKSEVPTIVVVEWALWVPAMFGTFRFVPVKFQVLAINTIGVVGQTFLAYMANHAKNNQDTVVVVDDDDDTDDDVNEMNKNVNAVVVNKEQEHQHERAPRVVVSTAQHVLESVGVIEKNGDVPPEVVVEDKVVPLVLNTIIRKHTPKHVDLDMKKGDD